MNYVNLPEELVPIVDEMFIDLTINRLEVCLIPSKIPECARDGGMIRAVTNQNPLWYQHLCEMYPSERIKKRRGKKDYTKINRQNIISVLEKMIKNKRSKSMYAEYIISYARSAYEDYMDLLNDSIVPWNNQF